MDRANEWIYVMICDAWYNKHRPLWGRRNQRIYTPLKVFVFACNNVDNDHKIWRQKCNQSKKNSLLSAGWLRSSRDGAWDRHTAPLPSQSCRESWRLTARIIARRLPSALKTKNQVSRTLSSALVLMLVLKCVQLMHPATSQILKNFPQFTLQTRFAVADSPARRPSAGVPIVPSLRSDQWLTAATAAALQTTDPSCCYCVK